MLKAFRRRFIFLNMSLAGIALLAAFVIIGTLLCHNEYADLRTTMENVLKPWNAENANTSKNSTPQEEDSAENKDKPARKSEAEKANTEKPSEKKEDGSQPKNSGNKKTDSEKTRERNDNITTIFYYPDEHRYAVLSEIVVFDEDTDEVVHTILKREEDFGTISQYQILYCRLNTRTTSGRQVKMAVCSEEYIQSRLFRIVGLLAMAYVLSMLFLLVISIRLAGFAERPLRQSIERERSFVADISHDLKTPITVIMANNALLKANPAAAVSDNMQWIESTDRASQDMMQLISDMLTLSEVDKQPKKSNLVSVSLSSAAERCILQFESVAYEKNVLLEEDIEEGLTVYASETAVKRICGGLMENAFKYEPDGGCIIVKAYGQKHKACFMVQNKNSTIPPEDLPHIFDRFYRSDKARTQSKGHGLGLPIIQQMVSLCGGDIQVSSNEQDGTAFTVTFRRA